MAADSVEDILKKSKIEDVRGDMFVLRRDFSQVVYLVANGLSQRAANFVAAHFNDLNHHQTYWPEPANDKLNGFLPSDVIPDAYL